MTGRSEVTFEGFVRAERGRLIDGQGRPLVLRGVGLGNWLLPEGYMWRFPREAPQSPRAIEAFVSDLVGPGMAAAFWSGFRERFIGEADVRQMADLGFDHVRIPLNARLLIDDDGALIEEGFADVDRLLGWCRRHGLWAILDLHGAPGGQTGTNIDDSPRGRPDLFLVGGAYRDRTIDLWTAIARRYRAEPAVAAFDLLNEPLPHDYADRHAGDLLALYRDLTEAIRAVDPEHCLSYEGTRWATDWAIFREAPDPNALLQFHRYWCPPDRSSVAPYLEVGAALGLPIYMGEGGENDPDWLATAFGLYEDLGISWNLWPWKKLGTWTSPISILPPAGWGVIVDVASGRGPRPPAEEAQRTLAELLEHLSIDACEQRPDVVAAVFHRVPVRLPAEAFGFAGPGVSYQTASAQPLPDFRADDRVTIRPVDGSASPGFGPWDEPLRPPPRFEVVLGPGDWIAYRVELASRAGLCLEIALDPTVDPGPAGPGVLLDGVVLPTALRDAAVLASTQTPVPPGRHVIRITGRAPGTAVRSVAVTLRSLDSDCPGADA